MYVTGRGWWVPRDGLWRTFVLSRGGQKKCSILALQKVCLSKVGHNVLKGVYFFAVKAVGPIL